MKHLLLILTIVSVEPDHWFIEWTPHSLNKAIVIVTRCEGGRAFFAYNRFDIDANTSQAMVRQVYIPRDSTACWAGAEIMRNDGDDPTQEYRAEWSMTKVE